MFGSKRRAEQREITTRRIGELEDAMRDVYRRLSSLEARPTLPVEEVRELRQALAGKINAAIEAHAHRDAGGFPIKVS